MRILHVIESLGVGGAELALATLLGALQRQGHTVAVAVMRPPLDGVDALAAQGIHTHCLPARAQWNLPGRAQDLARLARRLDIDILHAHLYFPAVCTALARRLHLCTAATVVTFHNLAYVPGVNRAGFGLWLRRQLARRLYPDGFDRMIAVSCAVAEHYRAALGLRAIDVIHNPVDVAAMETLAASPVARHDGTPHLVVPGRLVHEKGHADLLRALASLHTQGWMLRTTLAGGGPLRQILAREIAALGLADHVHITGTLAHTALLALVCSADIVVVPSRFEGLGLAALEAMALRRPLVATSAGGLAEVVEHGVSGLVVPPNAPQALAAAIAALLADSALRAGLAVGGRRRVEQQFALPLIGAQLHALYLSLHVSGAAPERHGDSARLSE